MSIKEMLEEIEHLKRGIAEGRLNSTEQLDAIAAIICLQDSVIKALIEDVNTKRVA